MALCLIAGLTVCWPVRSTSAAPLASASSKLKWHARGVPLKPAEETAEKPIPKPAPAEPKAAADPVDSKAAQAKAANKPAKEIAPPKRLAARSSRAKLRDSIMQVSRDSTQDPFDDTRDKRTAKIEEEELPAAEEPAERAGTEPVDAEPSPLQTRPDPFGDEPIPTPPSSEREPSGLLDEGISTMPGDIGCKGYEKECLRAIADLQSRDITKIVVGLVIEGVEGEDFPCDCKLGGNVPSPPFEGRNFARTCFSWKATGTCHKPLYFEDVQLERYGHSWNPVVQPFMSAGHFFVSVPLLPYKMGLNPPNECMYTLGYYRPGSCAPYMLEPLPLSLRAAIYEGLGATGFAFWFWP